MARRETRIASPGANIDSWEPGFLIRGIYIDNPSGSWLVVKTATLISDYVPPYTLGWSRGFITASQVISIQSQRGPFDALSTNAGDKFTATITEEAARNSDGVAFIPFASTQRLFTTNTAVSTTGSCSLLPVVASKRYRIWTLTMGVESPPIITDSPRVYSEAYVTLAISNISGAILYWGPFGVSTISPTIVVDFGDNGMDTPIGEGINGQIVSFWPDNSVVFQGTIARYTLSYQVV